MRNAESQVSSIHEHQNPYVFLILMRGRETEDTGAKLLGLNFLGIKLGQSFLPPTLFTFLKKNHYYF